MTAAYVHVPFCGRVCPYCDFAVVAGRDGLTDSYVDAVISEIGMEQSIPALDAVFLGGGTPSRLPAESLARILQALADRFGFADNVEVSLEANPEDWTGELAAGLVRAGFNRVSFGAQSFDPAVLRYLGRQHSPADIDNGVAVSRRAGFASVSLDLIFGAPLETLASWSATVDAALKLEPDHVSTYALTVERGTALSRLVSAGAAAPDPDDQADKYELAQRRLVAAGLDHYEVSNYARAGTSAATTSTPGPRVIMWLSGLAPTAMSAACGDATFATSTPTSIGLRAESARSWVASSSTVGTGSWSELSSGSVCGRGSRSGGWPRLSRVTRKENSWWMGEW